MNKKTFYAPDIDIFYLAQSLEEWLAGQEFETQQFPSQDGGVTIQARKESTLRTLTGMAAALSAVIRMEGEHVSVEMGNAKWVEKGAVAAVGVLVFWPALITAGVGAYQQNQLQNNAWQFIEKFIKSNSAYADSFPSFGQAATSAPGAGVTPNLSPGSPPPPVNLAGASNLGSTTAASSAPSAANCAQCGRPLRQGARFCDNCGAPVPVTDTCPSCGKQLRPGAKFCDECGAPVGR